MDKKIKKYKSTPKKDTLSANRNISRDEINKAVKDFLDKGGTISRIEPEWIEEGSIYCFDSD